jgi:hypothetical protein
VSPDVWNIFSRKVQQLCYHLPTLHHKLFQGMLPGTLRMDCHSPSNFQYVGKFSYTINFIFSILFLLKREKVGLPYDRAVWLCVHARVCPSICPYSNFWTSWLIFMKRSMNVIQLVETTQIHTSQFPAMSNNVGDAWICEAGWTLVPLNLGSRNDVW